MPEPKYPKIEIDGKVLYQIACKACRRAHNWKIYSDGKVFIAVCKCGHHIEIKGEVLQRRPSEAIPLRFFT